MDNTRPKEKLPALEDYQSAYFFAEFYRNQTVAKIRELEKELKVWEEICRTERHGIENHPEAKFPQ